jgi:beta-phosphoglucomutase
MPSDIMHRLRAVIFDLDGVIVDTAQFHFAAWKTLAAEWNYSLSLENNEQLKGVSRMDSVRKIAQWARIHTTEQKLIDVAERKNEMYLNLCTDISPDYILPGIVNLIKELKANGVGVALGSASKNARFVLEQLGLLYSFDAIVDGNDVSHSKPNPEVFLKAAQMLDVLPKNCLVIEDAPAGIEAALSADMHVVGLGNPNELNNAHLILPNAANLNMEKLNKLYQYHLT